MKEARQFVDGLPFLAIRGMALRTLTRVVGAINASTFIGRVELVPCNWTGSSSTLFGHQAPPI